MTSLFKFARSNTCSLAARPLRTDLKRVLHSIKSRGANTAVDGLTVAATNRAQATAKRFWKNVGIEDRSDSIVVTLDKRPLKTPAGTTLIIPKSKRLLATLIAHEWENQETLIRPFALPMTSLASRAIDGFKNEETRTEVKGALLKYLDTDAICFFEDYPPALVDLQQWHWPPILNWARREFQADIRTFDSLLSNSQPLETKEIFWDVLNSLDAWQLAATERAVYASKSLIIALALTRGRLSIEEAAAASQVEVASQIQKWGEVEDTHDVDYHDIRRQLASAACLLVGS
ncbi:ATP12-domain-containing protein [Ramaria rubella]|nr:ATP12-domain-containing protein [Ramaria rubella]